MKATSLSEVILYIHKYNVFNCCTYSLNDDGSINEVIQKMNNLSA